jgi:hypothetical protein
MTVFGLGQRTICVGYLRVMTDRGKQAQCLHLTPVSPIIL